MVCTQLILCAGTLQHAGFVELCDAARVLDAVSPQEAARRCGEAARRLLPDSRLLAHRTRPEG